MVWFRTQQGSLVDLAKIVYFDISYNDKEWILTGGTSTSTPGALIMGRYQTQEEALAVLGHIEDILDEVCC